MITHRTSPVFLSVWSAAYGAIRRGARFGICSRYILNNIHLWAMALDDNSTPFPNYPNIGPHTILFKHRQFEILEYPSTSLVAPVGILRIGGLNSLAGDVIFLFSNPEWPIRHFWPIGECHLQVAIAETPLASRRSICRYSHVGPSSGRRT